MGRITIRSLTGETAMISFGITREGLPAGAKRATQEMEEAPGRVSLFEASAHVTLIGQSTLSTIAAPRRTARRKKPALVLAQQD